MTGAEKGFLLLTSHLSNPNRHPLSAVQLRTLADRVSCTKRANPEQELTEDDLTAMGYGRPMAQRILSLLGEEEVLEYYLKRGEKANCVSVTRVSEGYPRRLRRMLGTDSPGCLWAKGDLTLLAAQKVALVGSRDLNPENRAFAEEVGRQAARQGYVLVSGNARGADQAAQNACLRAGGRVISVVADELANRHSREGVLYLSEEDFDAPFSSQRALSRNRVIHALAERTFVAQCSLGTGGTWDGTVKNLRYGWSDVFCFRDGSEAPVQLAQMGAVLIEPEYLQDFRGLEINTVCLFDQ